MGKPIPRSREWRVTLESGDVWSVLAPTRRIAVMNLRDANVWDAIATVGAVRKDERKRGPLVERMQ